METRRAVGLLRIIDDALCIFFFLKHHLSFSVIISLK